MKNRPFSRFNALIPTGFGETLYALCGSEHTQQVRREQRLQAEGRVTTTGIKPIKGCLGCHKHHALCTCIKPFNPKRPEPSPTTCEAIPKPQEPKPEPKPKPEPSPIKQSHGQQVIDIRPAIRLRRRGR